MRRKKKHADVITDKDENSVATLEKKKIRYKLKKKSFTIFELIKVTTLKQASAGRKLLHEAMRII